MDTISYLNVNGVDLEIADSQARTNVTDLQANKADKTVVNTSIGEIEQDILELRAAVGTPLVASTAAGMLDYTKIYVYTGSESNYTFGDWYYWNGSSWVSGGVYNSLGFNTDYTLSIKNMAADSEAAGKVRDQILSNNSYDILAPLTKTGRTHNDITYAWDSKNQICHISGTADRDSFNSFYSDHTSLPFGMVPGKSYQLEYSDSTIYIDIYFFDANDAQIGSAISTKANRAVDVPNAAAGFTIRFRVPSGKTVDTYVSPKLLTSKSNLALEQSIENTNISMNEMREELLEYFPKDVAKYWGTPNKTSQGIVYTYSNDEYTVVGTCTGSASFNNLYSNKNSLPEGITSGMDLLVEYNSEQVYLRFAWYDSEENVIGRNVIKEETLIHVPEGTIGAIIRLEVYYGKTVDETIHYPIALDGITTAYLSKEVKEIEEEIENDLKTLKVLVFGSSFSYSTLGYVPIIINEIAPKLNFTMGILYISGGGINNHIDYFNNNTEYVCYSEYSSITKEWTNSEDTYTSKDVLGMLDWDVIVLQQNQTHSDITIPTNFAEIEQLADLLVNYINSLTTKYSVDFMLNLPQCRGAANDPALLTYPGDTILEKSNNSYLKISSFAQKAIEDSAIITSVLPSGTAVQNFRNSTDTSNIGTEGSGYLCDDQYSHLRNGIGPLIAGYAATIMLLKYVCEKTKSMAIQITPTDSLLSSINYWTRGSHGSCVGVTDSNKLLGQKCAIMAIKYPFEIKPVS